MREMLSRVVLWLSCAGFAVALVWLAVSADGDVPAHFDGSGVVTRRESASSFILSMAGVAACAVLFASVRVWISRLPAQAINLPSAKAHRYWTDPVRRSEFDRKMSEDLEWIGAATIVLLSWFSVVAGTARGDSVSVWLLAVPTAVYLLGILGYAIYVVRGGKYRVPSPG